MTRKSMQKLVCNGGSDFVDCRGSLVSWLLTMIHAHAGGGLTHFSTHRKSTGKQAEENKQHYTRDKEAQVGTAGTVSMQ